MGTRCSTTNACTARPGPGSPHCDGFWPPSPPRQQSGRNRERSLSVQDLDGDVATELAVARAVDLAHAAGAEQGDNGVRADLLIHHRDAAARGRRFQEPGGCRLVGQQRFDLETKALIVPARRLQERAPLLGWICQRGVIKTGNPLA